MDYPPLRTQTTHILGPKGTKLRLRFQASYLTYSHLFNKRGAWNKRGGGAKVAKSLNVELGINEEGGIFGKN